MNVTLTRRISYSQILQRIKCWQPDCGKAEVATFCLMATAFILKDKKCCMNWLHNNVNVLNIPKVFKNRTINFTLLVFVSQ